VTSAFRRRV